MAPGTDLISTRMTRSAGRSMNTRSLIAALSTGAFRNKNNADSVLDPPTKALLDHAWRDLHALGDFLLTHHARAIAAAGMSHKALLGEMPFRWQSDFDLSWLGGYRGNQTGRLHE